MITRAALLRNIGQFDDVTTPATIVFTSFTLIYADNGRGKTTIAAILRSLASNDPDLILERRRLGSKHDPQVVIDQDDQQAVFQDGAWSKTFPDITIFDDSFIDGNVCSGTSIHSSHRHNLHELILGAKGVTLNQSLNTLIGRVEQHSTRLLSLGSSIPPRARGPYDVNDFCALQEDPAIGTQLRGAERRLAAAESAAAIRDRPGFVDLRLPDFDTDAITAALTQAITTVEADAAAGVRTHLDRLGHGGETWVADGMRRIQNTSEDHDTEVCPFCAQELSGSAIITLYQDYFSQAYENLRATIADLEKRVRAGHSGAVTAEFERNMRTAAETREFWKPFAELPPIDVDTAAISREWTAARDAVLDHLRRKRSSPLESLELSCSSLAMLATYRTRTQEIAALSTSLIECNAHLDSIREQSDVADVATLTSEIDKLRAQQSRFEPRVVSLCDAYLAEHAAKQATEQQRNRTRHDLDQYRATIFPAYEKTINDYLHRFNAAFRIGQVTPINRRSGSYASYTVVINQRAVEVTAEDGPSFRNTLSSGDRNALALAFFFASLEHDPHLGRKTVVFDDPMTSLDAHRSLRTRQEMLRLHGRVSQMIVLSHSKPFLCALWGNADANVRSALRVGRTENGSELAEWNVRNDSITEHDKRHEMVTRYVHTENPDNERCVAEALRPLLEAFIRVAYPGHCPPGSLLGGFVRRCENARGTMHEILPEHDIAELRTLLDYVNQFHHDSNREWEKGCINGAELADFAKRTLSFASKG